MNIADKYFKEVVGFEGLYEISENGTVKRLAGETVKDNGVAYPVTEKILKPFKTNKKGYLGVNLSKNRKAYLFRIHILVARAFLGECPKGYYVCHTDGDHTNNNIYNLRYDTQAQNRIDEFRNGGSYSKGGLIAREVYEIRQLYKNGTYTQEELAQLYNTTPQNIKCIVMYKTFKFIREDGSIEPSNTKIDYYDILNKKNGGIADDI